MYPGLYKLKYNFPLVTPQPADINDWAQAAVQQNLRLKAARFNAISKQKLISVESGQRLPNLNLVGQYGQDRINGRSGHYDGHRQTDSASVNLRLDFKPFQGGQVFAKVRQAQANYQLASAQMDHTHREVIANSRKSYLGVMSGISKIKADRLAIKSSRSALRSTEAGYRVGTQTINDVLLAQRRLYKAENNYAQARFEYLTTTLALKQAAGTLNIHDLEQINHWLKVTASTYDTPATKKKIKRGKAKIQKKSTTFSHKKVAQKTQAA